MDSTPKVFGGTKSWQRFVWSWCNPRLIHLQRVLSFDTSHVNLSFNQKCTDCVFCSNASHPHRRSMNKSSAHHLLWSRTKANRNHNLLKKSSFILQKMSRVKMMPECTCCNILWPSLQCQKGPSILSILHTQKLASEGRIQPGYIKSLHINPCSTHNPIVGTSKFGKRMNTCRLILTTNACSCRFLTNLGSSANT